MSSHHRALGRHNARYSPLKPYPIILQDILGRSRQTLDTRDVLFDAAPESMLLFALMERGEVAMMPAEHHPASNNIALIGRSSRPVGVAYDPIEQVRTHAKRIIE